MKGTKDYKAYKTAEAAYEEEQDNIAKLSGRFEIIKKQEIELLLNLDLVQREHDTAMDEAASKGDISLLDKAEASLKEENEALEAKSNEVLMAGHVLSKAEQLLRVKKEDFNYTEKCLLLSTAKKLEDEAIKVVDDKLKMAWMARSRATGGDSSDMRDRWFKGMFPWPQDDEYCKLSKLLE